jgi:hypothetical protein
VTPSDAPTGAPPVSLTAQLMGLLHDLPGLVRDRVELLSLEVQRAAITLAQIMALVVVVAILGVTAWLVLWAAVIVALVQLGVPLGWALLMAVAVNLVAAWQGVVRITRLLPRVSLPATRRHLVGPSTPESP